MTLPWWLASGAAVLSIGVAWRSFRVEPYSLKVTRQRLRTPLWPGGIQCKILHLTDLHLWAFGRREALLVSHVEREAPDLIALTGDYAESKAGMEALAQLLTALQSIAPVYAVLGDNDQEELTWQRELERTFASSGATLLRNEARLFSTAGGKLLVAGVDDPNTGRGRVDKLEARADRLLADAGGLRLKQIPSILLAHSPEIVLELRPWMSLVLTGHTHGGQICLPGGRALYTNTPACKGYASGLYKPTSETHLYVNRGIGTARIPARLFCPPEIALFELVGDAGQSS